MSVKLPKKIIQRAISVKKCNNITVPALQTTCKPPPQCCKIKDAVVVLLIIALTGLNKEVKSFRLTTAGHAAVALVTDERADGTGHIEIQMYKIYLVNRGSTGIQKLNLGLFRILYMNRKTRMKLTFCGSVNEYQSTTVTATVSMGALD